jgi:hypothetical protein
LPRERRERPLRLGRALRHVVAHDDELSPLDRFPEERTERHPVPPDRRGTALRCESAGEPVPDLADHHPLAIERRLHLGRDALDDVVRKSARELAR